MEHFKVISLTLQNMISFDIQWQEQLKKSGKTFSEQSYEFLKDHYFCDFSFPWHNTLKYTKIMCKIMTRVSGSECSSTEDVVTSFVFEIISGFFMVPSFTDMLCNDCNTFPVGFHEFWIIIIWLTALLLVLHA